MKELYDTVSKDGLQGVLMVFFLILSYKVYKMKSSSDSSCGKVGSCFYFKSHTENAGGNFNITDEHIEHTQVNNNPTDDNV